MQCSNYIKWVETDCPQSVGGFFMSITQHIDKRIAACTPYPVV